MTRTRYTNGQRYSFLTLTEDLSAGLVVFLVALPLSVGIALASNAPLFSGILSGIVGGIVVGLISGSHTSVSGPAAGLTAVVAAQISVLGSFEAFLMAVVLAGFVQIIMSIARMGYIAVFFPSSVIKGLLAAIGIILILKQIPHILGHDLDPIGDKSFFQPDNKNTITEIFDAFLDIHPGALLISVVSISILVWWDKFTYLKKLHLPSPLIVVIIGVLISYMLQGIGGPWSFEPGHLVQIPIAETTLEFFSFLKFPNFSTLKDVDVYTAALTIGLVASLESLLNIEAVDKLDPIQRMSPPNRELFAQGVGNVIVGMIGGIPLTSVIVRSSVNINAGVKTKVSTIWHGILMLGCVLLIPTWLNKIPFAALAAILLVTGWKLVSAKLMVQMWQEGKNQFLPFISTIIAIVFTDLLIGIIIGLCVSLGFILHSNVRSPIKKIMEKHATGDQVLHIELPNQVGFFYRAALESTLRSIPTGGHVLLDAGTTDYIDPDILDLIVDFQNTIAPAHGVGVSLKGFRNKYPRLEDQIQYVDFSNREMQNALTPQRVLDIFLEGNERFRNGTPLARDLSRLLNATSTGQFPMAVILSCIDSRTPAEIIFDLGLGDVFSVRIAGNVISRKVIGSMEYSCAVAGAKLIMVMGHTSCGAIRAAVDLVCSEKSASEATGCTNLDSLINEIKHSVNKNICKNFVSSKSSQMEIYANEVGYRNVLRTIKLIRERSQMLDSLVKEGKIAIVGSMYDISAGEVSFFQSKESSTVPLSLCTIDI
ncbi:MAG: bifunctional SulP family inorganic anion transporter/carbonic anhydrase [Parachlamydiaceae bacterium]|nr:bifunctional SulP family inorganic anion transporter/carbonic anhydrase [Parachlamydiaceae bacterium]